MRIAGVQMDVELGNVLGNFARMTERLREAAAHGTRLIIFPECALSGYCFDSREEALPHAEPLPGPATDSFQLICRELNCLVAFGLLEERDAKLYNSVALVGPEGLLAVYRKTHLPWLGVDRYTDYGDEEYSVTEVDDVRFGLNICYDAGFPEPARCLALLGVDLIALPTNWPPGAEAAAEYAINTRALENTIYYAAVNRVGVERGCAFIGQSRICDPLGRTLAHANHTNEEILYADIDPEMSRRKHLIRVAGSNEVNRIADRRPELYKPIVAPNKLQRPGRG
jgi:5-aminopentanamidase